MSWKVPQGMVEMWPWGWICVLMAQLYRAPPGSVAAWSSCQVRSSGGLTLGCLMATCRLRGMLDRLPVALAAMTTTAKRSASLWPSQTSRTKFSFGLMKCSHAAVLTRQLRQWARARSGSRKAFNSIMPSVQTLVIVELGSRLTGDCNCILGSNARWCVGSQREP